MRRLEPDVEYIWSFDLYENDMPVFFVSVFFGFACLLLRIL